MNEETSEEVPRMEWRMYDRGELYYITRGHREISIHRDGDFHYCHRCHQDPREAEICEWQITDLYHNLLANLVAIVTLAASAQAARLQVLKELS
jgi:hypothetical protein